MRPEVTHFTSKIEGGLVGDTLYESRNRILHPLISYQRFLVLGYQLAS